ncbi:YukJ family protein [Edaphobacter paludis]|uniref:YukJ family protein n=1 Tax=Edaphobacter paludis TaxID=3035702 RepID=A0AAU7CY65_9BACT
MPITNYSVLAGDPVSGKVVTGASTHYQITMNAPGGPFTVAVNIQSMDGSEVLYAIEEGFTPPDEAGLLALPMGMTALQSAPGGLALDFVRSQVNGKPMITRPQMTLLPQMRSKGSEEERLLARARSSALQNAVVTLLNMTIADKDGVIYAFGSAYADKGKVDGIHDIHMNQGNPVNNHGGDNGIWQDGALLIHLPSKATWTAVFIAFQTQSWTTDGAGNPA